VRQAQEGSRHQGHQTLQVLRPENDPGGSGDAPTGQFEAARASALIQRRVCGPEGRNGMRGTIEQVWEREDRDGQKYLAIRIGGRRYSVPEGTYFNGIEPGAIVDYRYCKSNGFRQITDLSPVDSRVPDAGTALDMDYRGRHLNGNSGDVLSGQSCKRYAYGARSFTPRIDGAEGWRAVVLEDTRVRPAEQAAFNLDFEQWYKGFSHGRGNFFGSR
jgi:hypothetical protein